MSRFFVKPENIGARTIEITEAGDLHHMRKVLRLRPEDRVDVSDGEEFEYKTVIESLDDDRAVLTIVDKQAFAAEPAVRVTLFQGIPKQSKMETIIQKCVELGVHEIAPVFMERTVVVDRGNMGKKVDRWQKVSSEAVKQCKRGIVPLVRQPVKTTEIIEEFGSFDLVVIPYENEEGTTIKEVLRKISEQDQAGKDPADDMTIALIIGPEGGFSDDEVAGIAEAGGHSVSLGKTTLRTETAGPAALAMIMYELEL